MRPNVSQACCVSQSGSCSLMEAVSPAVDASSSQNTAQQNSTSTSVAVEASASARSASSCGSGGQGAASRASFTVPCSSARSPGVAAGSSTRPISPGAKITSAPVLVRSNRPERCDQMNSISATKEITKADSRR